MTLGHSEPAPRPLGAEGRSAIYLVSRYDVQGSEYLHALAFPLRFNPSSAICRALAERGDYLRRLELWIADPILTGADMPRRFL